MADYGAIGKTYQLGYNRVLGGVVTLPNYRGVNLRVYSPFDNSTVQGIIARSELTRYIKLKYIAGFREHK
jgi:hypothetical protein